MKKIKWLLIICIASFFIAEVAFTASLGLLKPGDVLTVVVQGEPELSGDHVIDYSGSISIPLLGAIGVVGMKTADVSKLIEEHLSDGFLKKPVVSVSIKALSKNPPAFSSSSALSSDEAYTSVAASLLSGAEAKGPQPVQSHEELLIEIKDRASGHGIYEAVLCIDNRVYQSNRLGQILVTEPKGPALLLADGYRTLSGDFNGLLNRGKAGNPAYIALERTPFKEVVLCTLVDSKTRKPVRSAEVWLDGVKVLTNSRGEFKISGIKKEYGQVIIKKRGYKELKKVIDYKAFSALTIELSR